MKKFWSVVLVFVSCLCLCFGLAACGEKPMEEPDDTKTEEPNGPSNPNEPEAPEADPIEGYWTGEPEPVSDRFSVQYGISVAPFEDEVWAVLEVTPFLADAGPSDKTDTEYLTFVLSQTDENSYSGKLKTWDTEYDVSLSLNAQGALELTMPDFLGEDRNVGVTHTLSTKAALPQDGLTLTGVWYYQIANPNVQTVSVDFTNNKFHRGETQTSITVRAVGSYLAVLDSDGFTYAVVKEGENYTIWETEKDIKIAQTAPASDE